MKLIYFVTILAIAAWFGAAAGRMLDRHYNCPKHPPTVEVQP